MEDQCTHLQSVHAQTNQPEATFAGCRPPISQKKCLDALYTINYIHTEVDDKRKICHNLCLLVTTVLLTHV